MSSRVRMAALVLAAVPDAFAWAADGLVPGTPALDPPTLTALGIKLPIAGDDNFDAQVTVRYRPAGTTAWRNALPLFRVHPASVVGRVVTPQFAGSVFDLRPATTYEIELHATDADGPVDRTFALQGTTRPVPRSDPAMPRARNVSNATQLQSALGSAQPGDVVVIANGTYAGPFTLRASGTADNPIVVRGQSDTGVVLDGANCTCNVIEVYGSFVTIERLTIQNAQRALRFQTVGAEGNVVRRVRARNVRLGFGSNRDQKDFYLCDNALEGRLAWPLVYTDNGGANANDDGIRVEGNGHVVCHNQLVGFGDALKVEQDGARAVDFYGNEILSAYDNGIELDGGEGNMRCVRNRFTNTFATISFQPIFGGPAYAVRNVVVNVAHEQLKFHALGGTPPLEPSGMLVYHNTFVSPAHALFLATSDASRDFDVANNLLVGPQTPTNGRTVDWTGPIENGRFDYDGWYPDAAFRFNFVGRGLVSYANLAALKADGLEQNGVALAGPVFASGLVAPGSYTATLPAHDVTLAPTSNALDKGRVLPNVNDGYQGTGPDLGALERGCPLPIFGVRPDGVDESNQPFGCDPGSIDGGTPAGDAGTAPATDAGSADAGAPGRDDAGGGDGSSPGGVGGACGCTGAAERVAFVALVGLAPLARRRRGAWRSGIERQAAQRCNKASGRPRLSRT